MPSASLLGCYAECLTAGLLCRVPHCWAAMPSASLLGCYAECLTAGLLCRVPHCWAAMLRRLGISAEQMTDVCTVVMQRQISERGEVCSQLLQCYDTYT